jgi:hypothetical protein
MPQAPVFLNDPLDMNDDFNAEDNNIKQKGSLSCLFQTLMPDYMPYF